MTPFARIPPRRPGRYWSTKREFHLRTHRGRTRVRELEHLQPYVPIQKYTQTTVWQPRKQGTERSTHVLVSLWEYLKIRYCKSKPSRSILSIINTRQVLQSKSPSIFISSPSKRQHGTEIKTSGYHRVRKVSKRRVETQGKKKNCMYRIAIKNTSNHPNDPPSWKPEEMMHAISWNSSVL